MEWSLDGPLPNLCPVIPTSNQYGHQAKNRKKGVEILIVHCCFSISQHGRWFSPGTPASSTTKTGRHDIVEILLKVALKRQKSN
jgi:hypothetical protein